MRTGVRLGVDVGAVRVGLATSDPSGLIATPVQTLKRDFAKGSDLDDVVRLAQESQAIEIVVGLPLNMSGADTASTAAAREWAARMKRRCPTLRVCLVDERLTSVSAHRSLRESGVEGRQHKLHVDQQAAVFILQAALETERNTGRPAGVEVGGRKPRAPRHRSTSKGDSTDG